MNRQEYIKAAEGYLKALPSMNKSEQTVTAYALVLKKFTDFITEENAEAISPNLCVEFQSSLFNSGVKANAIKCYLTRLHTFFEYCIEMRIIAENPVNMNYVPKSQPIEYDVLSHEEILKLLSEKPNNKHKILCRNYAIVVLLIQSGLRNSELRNLTVSDLDLENGTITIKHGKGDKRRLVAFPDLSRKVIGEYLESGVRPSNLSLDDYLFGSTCDETGNRNHTGKWRQFSIVALNGLVKRYVKRVIGRNADIHCHSMRHCAASLWDDMGVSMRDAQLALGHASLATTERIYTHVLNRQKATNNINMAFSGLSL